ncbi:transcriptional regulator, TetR family [Flavobacterium succinicans]|jgi:AcrR family transcriptional regulator|uniref:Transcriptional regulator, TetR family n=1 Tax=Flavobacterium succinicans TaxID=29536 RepID=A0A1I4V440_9FLAO|nr:MULTISPECIES: TetR/AcrR family transcriptional regulator [Flavobacterium]OOV28485.1 TetR family transcriptional regulator [Flavobacterium sp. LM5]SFM95938.1 transcriptional regulator, TetR family [Flavobacterium succinicans]
MKDKIMAKASELFLKLGFKSITMDDIACEMCISKKTIYKYFCNKEVLIEESTEVMHKKVHQGINAIVQQNFNAIEENFEIRKMFKEMLSSGDTSPMYQLKKHYPDIYFKLVHREVSECNTVFKQNILKGIEQGLYRPNIPLESYVKFYYTIIFDINGNTISEKEAQKLELEALEYHTRAMATLAGIIELERQLEHHLLLTQNNNNTEFVPLNNY